MSCQNEIFRDGTNQFERFLNELNTTYVKVDERTQKDILVFVHQLAQSLAYYDNSNQPSGNWQNFFNEPETLDELIAVQELEEPQDLTPHNALLLAFTKLFAIAQDELNTITQRHLDFYYSQILRIKRRKAVPDQVQVLFELTKGQTFDQDKIDIGTRLNGGKDVDGNALIYKIDQEIIVNRAKIDYLSTLFVDEDQGKSRIFVAPFANSADGLGTPFEDQETHWPAFGETQMSKAIESRNMVDADIGFAISSPVLLLHEGTRTINLTLHFASTVATGGVSDISLLTQAFRVYCSGAKEWFEPDSHTTLLMEEVSPDLWGLSIQINIGVGQPSLSFYNAELLGENYTTPWPLIKFVLKPKSLGYDTLRQFRIDSVDITVEVKGVKNLMLQNEQGLIDPAKPFLVFGALPRIDSSLIVGSQEIFQKKLNSLSLVIDWHDIPDPKLGKYYEGYDPETDIDNNSFEASVEMLNDNNWDTSIEPNVSLFKSSDAAMQRTIEITESDFNVQTAGINYKPDPETQATAPYRITDDRGFVRLRLKRPTFPFKAFGHKEFPTIYAQQAIALAKYDASTSTAPEPLLPNPPYTPAIKSLSIDYSSQITIVPDRNDYETIFQIGPFGHSQVNGSNSYVVPQFNNQGELFLGISGITAPQTLNFLFQFEQGTANEDILLSEESIKMYFLKDNKWEAFSEQDIRVDTTYNFLVPGIITLVLPLGASSDHHLMPSGMYWVKVSIESGAEGASQLRNVYPNAVTATLIMEQDNGKPGKYDNHLLTPLPPETIKNLVKKQSGIKSVKQLFPSFNGEPTEKNDSFYTRVSERLRHKQRGVQNWDLERLVLDKFPNIFKVKSLGHTNPDSSLQNGSVTLIVVSNLRNQDSANPYEPRTGKVVLDQIHSFLTALMSPFIGLYVENPVYESILIDVKIGFREGYDPGYYTNILNQELKEYLSPWAFEDGKDIVIGGRIYKSSILLFIENREYVDYVVDLKLYHIHEGPPPGGLGDMEIGFDFVISPEILPKIDDMTIGTDFIVGDDVQVACATTDRSILVTAAEHWISALRSNELFCPGSTNLGIGFMTVGIDFIVSDT